ncbi:MAG: right-handed parallel beta-helix repeat-containing protein [Gemmataceae bacterium]
MHLNWWFGSKASKQAARRPLLERLEERSVPAIFAVSNLNDSGAGSLRQALLDANLAPGLDTIQFSVAGSIQLTSASLPAIVDPVNLQGNTAPGFTTAPVVELDLDGFQGLRFAAGSSGSTLRGLGVVNAESAGVIVESSNNVIAGNYIGLDLDGVTPEGNGTHGLVFRSTAAGNIVGSSDAADRNVISGNRGAGIAILGSSRNTIQGNYIGTDVTGLVDVGNRSDGILVSGAARKNLIGGTALALTYGSIPVQGNLISGNDGNGVTLTSGARFNSLSGNFIGTTITGIAALGNQLDGVLIANGANDNSLIGTYRNLPPFVFYNVVSGNHGNGLRIHNANNIIIHANYFGLGSDDASVVGNSLNGVLVEGTSTNITFGGVIPLGNVSACNGLNGVEVRDRVSNFLSFNTFSGTGSFTTNPNLGNGLDGMLITSSGSGIVLRTNVFSSNGDDGVEVSGRARGVQIAQSLFGTNTDGTSALPNGDNGIEVGGHANGIVIGGLQPYYSVAPHNVISANLGNGVAVIGDARNTRINYSFIGTVSNGETALPNGKAGVFLGERSAGTIVGSRDPGLPTVIGGNTGDGIEIRGSNDNLVLGALIGVTKDASTPLPNQESGVLIVGGLRNRIGTTQRRGGNLIANNGAYGVHVLSGQRNTIRGNSIYSNAALGIALGAGANGNRPAPSLTSALPSLNNQIRIRGTATGRPLSLITLDFYVNYNDELSPTTQGRFFIGSLQVRTNRFGVASFLFVANNPPPGAQVYTATVTDALGNTSAFSTPIATPGS